MSKEMSKKRIRMDGLDIPIRASYGYVPRDYPLHSHEYYELEIVLDGSATNILNGERHALCRGSVCILTPSDCHSVELQSRLTIYNINIDERYMTDRHLSTLARMKGRSCFSVDDKLLKKVSQLADMLVEECYKPGGGCSAELVECIFAMLLGSMKQSNSANPTLGSMRRAVTYMNEHYRESPTLATVAAVAGFNPTYFSELFKRTLGETYVSRLNSLKIGYAKALLCQGMSVSAVCEEAGFGSPSSFFTTFKRHTGKSPSDFKRECERASL